MAKKKTSTVENFANNLRLLMRLGGLNQTELAKKSGVSQKTISNILNNGQNPTIETADLLAAAFGLEGWHLIMPNLPTDLVSSPTIEALFNSFLGASTGGREMIIKVAEREAEYNTKKDVM